MDQYYLIGGTVIALIAVGVYVYTWWYSQQAQIPLSIQNLGDIFTKNIDNTLILIGAGVAVAIIMLLMTNHAIGSTQHK